MKAREIIKDYLKKSLRRTHVLTGVVLGFIVGSAILYAGEIYNSLIEFHSGDVASASQVNDNFRSLADAIDVNREGLACSLTTPLEVSTTGTDQKFTCDNVIKNNLSTSTGTYFYVAPEDGLYRVHRTLFYADDSVTTTIYQESSNDFHQVYIDGVEDTYDRDVYHLNAGQGLDIILYNGASASYIREDSVVYVKRIF